MVAINNNMVNDKKKVRKRNNYPYYTLLLYHVHLLSQYQTHL